MNNQQVSVIIPVFNQKQYIVETIESALNQTRAPLEIIIVDDGSTDGLEEQIRTLSIPSLQYCYQAHQGAGAARNKGVDRAKGHWLAFLDADDVWTSQKIELQLACAKKNNTNIIFSNIQQFITPEYCVGRLAELTIKNEVMPGYCASTLLIEKAVFQQIGYFDSDYKLGEFIAWYMLMRKNHFHSCLLDEILVHRRIHRNNSSAKNKSARQDYLHLLHAAING